MCGFDPKHHIFHVNHLRRSNLTIIDNVRKQYWDLLIKIKKFRADLDVKNELTEESVFKSVKMLDYANKELIAIESSIDLTTKRSEIFNKLRVLSLSDFGLFLLSIPNPDFPKLSNLLPRMATDEVQMNWTGCSGLSLLTQTLDFVRSVSYNFTKLTGRTLQNTNILDFGCGYGRITRLMYYFTNEDQIYAMDPGDESLETCRSDGLTKNFLLSEYLPTTLPVTNTKFDLIFAFSVFTHLSNRATLACLNTLADYIKPGGVIVITIRPVEYWDIDPNATKLGLSEQQKSIHNSQGFSFLPQDWSPIVDEDITFGDTSMTFEWLKNSFPNLHIVGQDRSLSDPYQIYVFIQKQLD